MSDPVETWVTQQRGTMLAALAKAESPPEARLLVELFAHGDDGRFTFGAPGSGAEWALTTQEWVRTPGKGYRLDVALRKGTIAVAVEVDGHAYHADPEQRDRDDVRDLALRLAGWKEVIRLPAWQVNRSPAGAVETILGRLRHVELIANRPEFKPTAEMTDDEFERLVVAKFERHIAENEANGCPVGQDPNRRKLAGLRLRREQARIANELRLAKGNVTLEEELLRRFSELSVQHFEQCGT